MSRYEVEVNRDGQLWCRITVDVPWGENVIHDISERFPVELGYTCQLFKATEARRLLESGTNGVRLIAIDYQLEPVAMTEAGEHQGGVVS
ncbi:MAG: hypothetical protein OQL08_00330 [Gammaproteobacteria bacterium]|nr:hypothetical protein [Gammaproteobacteria bacterium]